MRSAFGSAATFTPTLLICYAISFVVHIGAVSLSTLLPFHVLDLGGSRTQVGLLFSVSTIVSMVLRPTVGAWVDRFGARRVMAPGVIALVVTSVAFHGVSAPGALIVLMIGIGLSNGLISTPASVVSATTGPAAQRSEALGNYYLASSPAIAVAPPLGFGLRAALAWFFIVYPLWLIACRAAFRGISDRLGHARVALVALVLQAVGYAILVLPPTAPGLTLAAVALATGGAVLYPTLVALVVERAERHERGLALGTLSGSWDLGVVIGSALVGIVADRIGYGAGFAVGALGTLLGVIALALIENRHVAMASTRARGNAPGLA